MGKVIATLSETDLPRQAIFGERFVVECCESFHLHHRNLRIELTPEDFVRVRAALEQTARAHREAGEPTEHPHLELGRAKLEPAADGAFSIELCENLYKRYPTGWDARFHRDDSFVHVHWRDLRFEMSNGEFLEVARAFGAAGEKMRAWQLKTLPEIFELLDEAGIVYVVIRNFENLPERPETGPHADLDLLVHPDHVERFDALLDARPMTPDPNRVQRRLDVMTAKGPTFIPTDVRVPGDGYFPDELAHRMLARRVRFRGFWVPSAEDHYLGLAHHVIHHKGIATGDYHAKLTWLAARAGLETPTNADATSTCARTLTRAGFKTRTADDPTVRGGLPLLHPVETLVTSRFLAVLDRLPVLSRVYIVGEGGAWRAIKHTSGTFGAHEHAILSGLDGDWFPKPGPLVDHGGHVSFEMEFIDGVPLSESEPIVRAWRFEEARAFVRSAVDLLTALSRAHVEHRDVRADNLFVRDGAPVLIDFGWATAPGHPMREPGDGWLGGEARAPDGGPCDAYGLGYVLGQHIAPFFPSIGPIARELMELRSDDTPDWPAIAAAVDRLEESMPESGAARADAFCRLGRYAEAHESLPSLGFWRSHLERLTGESSWSGEAVDPDGHAVPADLDPRAAARVLGEHLDAPGRPEPVFVGALLERYVLGPTAPSRAVLDLVLARYDELAEHVGVNALAAATQRADRQEEWLLAHLSYLADAGTRRQSTAFLRWLEDEGIEPIAPAAHALAVLHHRAGALDRAATYAARVVEGDPYDVACARILAEHAESTGADDRAKAAWRDVARLDPDDADARGRAARAGAPRAKTILRPDMLPRDPRALVALVRELVARNRTHDAIVAIEALADRWPEHAERLGPLAARLRLAASASNTGPAIRIVIDPLDENTYEPDPDVMRAELDALARTPLGDNDVVREAHAALCAPMRPNAADSVVERG